MARDGEDGSPPRERAALQFAAGATRYEQLHPESAAKNKQEIARILAKRTSRGSRANLAGRAPGCATATHRCRSQTSSL